MSATRHALVGAIAGGCILALASLHAFGSFLTRALNTTDEI